MMNNENVKSQETASRGTAGLSLWLEKKATEKGGGWRKMEDDAACPKARRNFHENRDMMIPWECASSARARQFGENPNPVKL